MSSQGLAESVIVVPQMKPGILYRGPIVDALSKKMHEHANDQNSQITADMADSFLLHIRDLHAVGSSPAPPVLTEIYEKGTHAFLEWLRHHDQVAYAEVVAKLQQVDARMKAWQVWRTTDLSMRKAVFDCMGDGTKRQVRRLSRLNTEQSIEHRLGLDGNPAIFPDFQWDLAAGPCDGEGNQWVLSVGNYVVADARRDSSVLAARASNPLPDDFKELHVDKMPVPIGNKYEAQKFFDAGPKACKSAPLFLCRAPPLPTEVSGTLVPMSDPVTLLVLRSPPT